jgi:hypothetical protein
MKLFALLVVAVSLVLVGCDKGTTTDTKPTNVTPTAPSTNVTK